MVGMMMIAMEIALLLIMIFHSFHVKWVKCAKDFRKIEGQQITQIVCLTERCIIEG